MFCISLYICVLPSFNHRKKQDRWLCFAIANYRAHSRKVKSSRCRNFLGLTPIAQDLKNAGSAPAIGVDQHSNFKNRQVFKTMTRKSNNTNKEIF